ncbi:YgjV family protein [Butyrivibrio sp. YAB3001]|uniref:YgjV family protein n=1 Tax=Butyrivibrio sp. YAB3001 TaxID=1520812 RepID=UPI0008F62432|nr:YgjV family protein [Butyrivibrio sp. YAB3001]SFC31797.1 inner membrane protein [Butyrivibrio sp. YAB3001]
MVTTEFLIEAIGYLGSALVLISFLMVSVFKLRVVNSIGSIIFTIYALIIHSYPTAVMNACLVLINIYYLVKMSNTTKDYDFLEVESNESILKYLIDEYMGDIIRCFPGIIIDLNSVNSRFVVFHNGKPCGLFLGNRKGSEMEITLDYCIPEYRDFSVGEFLLYHLPCEGIKKLIYKGPDMHHKSYLTKFGFEQVGDHYEKNF